MKPYPFLASNHFTVPVSFDAESEKRARWRVIIVGDDVVVDQHDDENVDGAVAEVVRVAKLLTERRAAVLARRRNIVLLCRYGLIYCWQSIIGW
jgi:hypothetical protein